MRLGCLPASHTKNVWLLFVLPFNNLLLVFSNESTRGLDLHWICKYAHAKYVHNGTVIFKKLQNVDVFFGLGLRSSDQITYWLFFSLCVAFRISWKRKNTEKLFTSEDFFFEKRQYWCFKKFLIMGWFQTCRDISEKVWLEKSLPENGFVCRMGIFEKKDSAGLSFFGYIQRVKRYLGEE